MIQTKYTESCWNVALFLLCMSAISISASYPISGYGITHRVLVLLSPLPKVPGSNPIRRWSSPGKSVSSTTHNWIVTTGRKSNNNRNSEFQFPNPSLGLWGVGQGAQNTSTNEPLARHKFFLTLTLLRLFRPKYKNAKISENHRNPVMLVFIRKLSLSPLIWVPIYLGSCHFQLFFDHFVLTKLATSSLRVNFAGKIRKSIFPEDDSPYLLSSVWPKLGWPFSPLFFFYKFCVCHPHLANLLGAVFLIYVYLTYTVKCWFCSLDPIVKYAHCKQYKCERSRM